MNNKITYRKEGDYLIPNLTIENSNEALHIGKYGKLRLNYIKNYKKGLYTELMLTGTLPKYLNDIENLANSRVHTIIKKLATLENVNEDLKCCNQMQWVQSMNNIKNRAEEFVLNEIIYV